MTDLPASPTAPSPSASTADAAPPASPRMRIHVSIVIALLVLTALIQVYAFRYVGSRAATWLQDTAPVAPQHYPGASDPQVAQQQGRLLAQFALAKERERMHLQLAVHYLQNYYMAIVVSMAMGAIAAIALFAITSRGWAAAHPLVKTVFVAATALATFFASFPTVFKQPENFTANLASYRNHIALENEILTYLVSGLKADGKEATLPAFLVHVDGELARLHQLALAMDPDAKPQYSFTPAE
jgi:hypothetical protein